MDRDGWHGTLDESALEFQVSIVVFSSVYCGLMVIVYEIDTCFMERSTFSRFFKLVWYGWRGQPTPSCTIGLHLLDCLASWSCFDDHTWRAPLHSCEAISCDLVLCSHWKGTFHACGGYWGFS
jgi:hypothetical protein